jgi:hypothetical protein
MRRAARAGVKALRLSTSSRAVRGVAVATAGTVSAYALHAWRNRVTTAAPPTRAHVSAISTHSQALVELPRLQLVAKASFTALRAFTPSGIPWRSFCSVERRFCGGVSRSRARWRPFLPGASRPQLAWFDQAGQGSGGRVAAWQVRVPAAPVHWRTLLATGEPARLSIFTTLLRLA